MADTFRNNDFVGRMEIRNISETVNKRIVVQPPVAKTNNNQFNGENVRKNVTAELNSTLLQKGKDGK